MTAAQGISGNNVALQIFLHKSSLCMTPVIQCQKTFVCVKKQQKIDHQILNVTLFDD